MTFRLLSNRLLRCALLPMLLFFTGSAVAGPWSWGGWHENYPHYAVFSLKPGVDTRDTVIAAFGKPDAVLGETRAAVSMEVRHHCEISVYQRRFDNVLKYEGRISFREWGKTYKATQVVRFYFDTNGRLCAADVERAWTLPGAYTTGRLVLRDYPGRGWTGGEWEVLKDQLR